MASLPLDVRPANPVHALAAPAATFPANDNASCWTRDRRARVLLASIAATPPVKLSADRAGGNPFDVGCAYAGFRAEALEAIRMEYGDAALATYCADALDCLNNEGEELPAELNDRTSRSEQAFDAWCQQPTATQAIDAVLGSC